MARVQDHICSRLIEAAVWYTASMSGASCSKPCCAWIWPTTLRRIAAPNKPVMTLCKKVWAGGQMEYGSV